MTGLSHDAIAAKVGTAFDVVPPGSEAVSLTLRSVHALNDSGRPGGSFRLEFVGPASTYLPQATYSFGEGGAEPVDIFIVPIAAEGDSLVYEAIFY